MLTIGELRQLLFWASFGVSQAKRGSSYSKTIIPTIRKLAKDIKFSVETKRYPLSFLEEPPPSEGDDKEI